MRKQIFHWTHFEDENSPHFEDENYFQRFEIFQTSAKTLLRYHSGKNPVSSGSSRTSTDEAFNGQMNLYTLKRKKEKYSIFAIS